ncbi:hypothetical protein AUTU_47290 (plasmid) [Aureibacter tunicatorum]|nr:hypothetical protein AUTU_47290 [Aureibacter tunicatorum]
MLVSLSLLLGLMETSCDQKVKREYNPELSLEMVRKPYLQNVWEDSASVLWKTNNAAKDCKIAYGTNLDSLTNTQLGIVDYQDYNTLNQATVKGLEPNTKYYYAIYSNDSLLLSGPDYYFISEPEKGTNAFSFYAMGDIGEPKDEGGFPEVTSKQIDKLNRRPDFGIGLGDIVYPDGESSAYDANFFEPMSPIMGNIPFYPALGNHDWHVNPDENFKKEWKLPNNEHYYSFDYQNAHFIALDSREGDFFDLDKQTEWLKEDLDKTQGKYDWIFVYLHHNGRTCTYKEDYPHVMGLYDIFAQNNVDLVLNGHAHTYERLKPFDGKGQVVDSLSMNLGSFPKMSNSFISITTGAGGKLKDSTKYVPDPLHCDEGPIVAHAEHLGHFSIITIDSTHLNFKGISSVDGNVFDEFEIQK